MSERASSPFPILFAKARALQAFAVRCDCGHTHPIELSSASLHYESASIAIVSGFASCPSCTLRSPIHERITALDDGIALEHRRGEEWVLDSMMRDMETTRLTDDDSAHTPLSPMDWIRGIARIIALITRRGR